MLGWAGRGGGGVELNVGVGWLGVEVAYLYAPAVKLGQVFDLLQAYYRRHPIRDGNGEPVLIEGKDVWHRVHG